MASAAAIPRLPGRVLLPTLWIVAVTVAWAALMTELFRRDIAWEVGEAPKPAPPPADTVGYRESFVIYRQTAGGERIRLGRAAATHQSGNVEKLHVVDSDLELERLPLISGRLVLRSQMRRKFDGRLDGFETEVHLKDFRAKITGSVSAGHCQARLELPGAARAPSFRFPVDESATEIAQEFQNFSRLPGLQVGQSWQVRMISVSGLVRTLVARLDQFRKSSADNPVDIAETPFEVRVATVTGRSTVDWNGARHDVLVVRLRRPGSSDPDLLSYVADDGRVLRQEVDGFGGRLVLERDPDGEAAADE
jgi:hypothetical protein